MNDLLLFFALPIATIILASTFVKLIKSPIDIAAIAFSIYLIVTFAVFDETFLIATIVYTVLAFISAFLTRLILKYVKNQNNNNDTTAITLDENENTENTLNLGIRNNFYRCNRIKH